MSNVQPEKQQQGTPLAFYLFLAVIGLCFLYAVWQVLSAQRAARGTPCAPGAGLHSDHRGAQTRVPRSAHRFCERMAS